ncbi:hypothetical protein [Geitlerinema sp. PCC 7407]|uniref:hypothetical protein n=1 Tax=Geitlerinema sp. PCC 7407 TaxID=1173025 RepID=UPI00029FC46C|nr:hypothetical protein [Geitlerinema sp. PCC 7407]AFY66623.1 hypothetical protein GEI7407_2143 [Geitlerinema sp. PCC 7407]
MATLTASEHLSDATLSKLLDADADLAKQESTLQGQLDAIQQKRQSLRVVIDMFSAGQAPPAAVTEGLSGVQLNGAIADAAPEKQSAKATPKSAKTAEAAPAPARRGRKPKAAAAAPVSPAPRKSRISKSRKTETSQYYLRDDFEGVPLRTAVAAVLHHQTDTVMDVASILNAIFREEMPKDVRNKARNRVLTILSNGVKEGDWYRGRTGKYSASKDVAQASLGR